MSSPATANRAAFFAASAVMSWAAGCPSGSASPESQPPRYAASPSAIAPSSSGTPTSHTIAPCSGDPAADDPGGEGAQNREPRAQERHVAVGVDGPRRTGLMRAEGDAHETDDHGDRESGQHADPDRAPAHRPAVPRSRRITAMFVSLHTSHSSSPPCVECAFAMQAVCQDISPVRARSVAERSGFPCPWRRFRSRANHVWMASTLLKRSGQRPRRGRKE